MNKVFFNGKIITMAESDETHRVIPEAVLVSDGMIKKVGSIASMHGEYDNSTEWIDLEGKCLMPAFIDAHSHIVMNGWVSMLVDLSGCCSFDDITECLRNYILEHNISADNIVLGFGYDHNFLKECQHPDRFVLDQISRTIPIVIMHISGHLSCVNSMVLELAHINKDTKDPMGGMIGRIAGSREPNGYLEEAGMRFAIDVIQMRITFNINTIIANMQKSYIENGITTVQEGAATEENIEILKRMADSGQLMVDVVAYPLIVGEGENIFKKYSGIDNKYQNHLKIGGYKIILDGSPQGKSAWLSEPYVGEEDGYCGYGYYENNDVEKYIMQAINEKRQILAHCNGDAASEQFLSVYEKCIENKDKVMDYRPVMIHCQTVRNDQLDRMAKINMIASMFVGHVWYWGDVHLRNLGETRGNYISPVNDALKQKVTVTFHQDTPVTKPNMLHAVWCAVNRISRGGKVLGKEQIISVYDALKAVTINAAYQYFEENDKGSIEEGKKADFIILNESPLDVPVDKIRDIKVLATIKEGIVIYRA